MSLSTLLTIYLGLSLKQRLVHGGWVDEDTPINKRKTTSFIDGTEYELVMSDEFNTPGRTFTDGHDPMWTALDKSDDDSNAAGGGSLHFYNSTMITTTSDGMLEILANLNKTEWSQFDTVTNERKKVTKHFKSGMLQSWNKFCFTGGILEVDVQFPGDPYIGGLWPAVWLLGNLGRATYEGSTNNIWPWSYNKCDRKLQEAQTVSACNSQNHYGLNSFQGRGSTEIDLIEVMAGDSDDDEPLPSTEPPITYPYADLTLQVAPGVPKNRPQPGYQPRYKDESSKNGHQQLLAQSWYDGLETEGNTTINPFFYGTYLGETRPEEPVTRNKNQVFQADAIGSIHQLTESHFNKIHTFRLEWQPGPGGRLDWFAKSHKINATLSIEGDGLGEDWIKAFTIKDEALHSLTGAQIPIEPSYLILNLGISSTWGFPYDVPDDCPKCYDCSNITCACNFHDGFCNMMETTRVNMLIDNVRIYQSKNHDAHVGAPHTVGCDPVGYPTREYIKGHEYLYMRSAPFVYSDTGSLKKSIQKGGGKCKANTDCGGINNNDNNDNNNNNNNKDSKEKGACLTTEYSNGFFKSDSLDSRCKCNPGYTGPFCLAQDHSDDELGAMELNSGTSTFQNVSLPTMPVVFVASMILLMTGLVVYIAHHADKTRREIQRLNEGMLKKKES